MTLPTIKAFLLLALRAPVFSKPLPLTSHYFPAHVGSRETNYYVYNERSKHPELTSFIRRRSLANLEDQQPKKNEPPKEKPKNPSQKETPKNQPNKQTPNKSPSNPNKENGSTKQPDGWDETCLFIRQHCIHTGFGAVGGHGGGGNGSSGSGSGHTGGPGANGGRTGPGGQTPASAESGNPRYDVPDQGGFLGQQEHVINLNSGIVTLRFVRDTATRNLDIYIQNRSQREFDVQAQFPDSIEVWPPTVMSVGRGSDQRLTIPAKDVVKHTAAGGRGIILKWNT